MKRKLVFLASLLSASLILSACGGLNDGGNSSGGEQSNPGGESSGGGAQSSGAGSIEIPGSANDAVNNLYQLATTQGVEITFSTTDEDGSKDSETVGFKNDILWVKGESAYKKEGNNIEFYEYDAEHQYYLYSAAVAESDQLSLNSLLKQLTAALYVGYQYADAQQALIVTSKKDVTFLGRSATEYTFSYGGLEGQANIKIVFDNQTGITLKLTGSATVVTGESSSATYELTSFVVGNAVQLPRLVKDSGSGQQDASRFANRVFEYQSHQGSGGEQFVGSVISLFEDGSLEIVISSKSSKKVLLGEYSINADDTQVTLNFKKSYDSQSQQYSEMATTWMFNYENDEFVLRFSNVSVRYVPNANKQPTHEQLPPDQGGQGGGQQQDDHADYKVDASTWANLIVDGGLVSMTSNFSAHVRSSDVPNGSTSYEFDNGKIHVKTVDSNGTYEYYEEFTSASGGFTYYVDNGVWNKKTNTFGIASFNNSLGILPIPFASMTFNDQTYEYDLASWQMPNGGPTYTDIHFSFEKNLLQKIRYITPESVMRETEIHKYSQTSVTLPEVGSSVSGQGQGGGEQTAKWPADEIAAKLEQLQLAVSVPAPAISDDNIVSVAVNVPADNSGLYITITLDSATNAYTVADGFVGGFEGFELDVGSCDFENGVYALLNEARDTIVKIGFKEDSAIVTLVIAQFNGNPYPANQIAAFFESCEIETTFPNLAMGNVSYGYFYSEGEGFELIMSPMGENTIETMISFVEATLLRANFKAHYLPLYDEEGSYITTFYDPTLQYYVNYNVEEDVLYVVVGLCDEESNIYASYPQEEISAHFIEGMQDSLPSLAVGNSLYQLEEDENVFSLSIYLQQSSDASRVMSDLTTRLTHNGFTFNEDLGAYLSANEEIVVFLNNVADKIIKVMVCITYETPVVEEPVDVTYTLVCDNTWDITVDDVKIYAYVWTDGGAKYEWIELEAVQGEDGIFRFTLETTDEYVGVKLVRFAPDSEIGWPGGADGSVNPNVTICNETDDIKLNGEGGELHFEFLG